MSRIIRFGLGTRPNFHLVAFSAILVASILFSFSNAQATGITSTWMRIQTGGYKLNFNSATGTTQLSTNGDVLIASTGSRYVDNLERLLADFKINIDTHGCEIAADLTGAHIYIHGDDGSLFTSENKGISWRKLAARVGLRNCNNDGLFGQGDFSVSTDGSTIAVQSYTDGLNNQGWNIYISRDFGANFSNVSYDFSLPTDLLENWKALLLISNNELIVGQADGGGTYNEIYRVNFTGGYTESTEEIVSTTNLQKEADQKAAAEAAAAKREAEKQAARADITSKLKNSKALTVDSFVKAEIPGITESNIAAVQAEILALPEESRTDINQVLKVAHKFEVVSKIGSDRINYLQSNSFVELGLIPATSKNKVALVAAVKNLPENARDTYAEIKAAIDVTIASLQARKDRLAAVITRNTSRNTK